MTEAGDTAERRAKSILLWVVSVVVAMSCLTVFVALVSYAFFYFFTVYLTPVDLTWQTFLWLLRSSCATAALLTLPGWAAVAVLFVWWWRLRTWATRRNSA